jgi:hypothetical protein
MLRLAAVHGTLPQPVGVHPPLLPVGLDAPSRVGPQLHAVGVAGSWRADEVDYVVGAGDISDDGQLPPAPSHRGGQLVAVGQHVGVVVEPGLASVPLGGQGVVAVLGFLQLAALLPAGPGEHPRSTAALGVVQRLGGPAHFS